MKSLIFSVCSVIIFMMIGVCKSTADSPRDVAYFFSKQFKQHISFYVNFGRLVNYDTIDLGGELVVWEGMLSVVLAEHQFEPETWFKNVNVFFPGDNPSSCKETGQCFANIIVPTGIIWVGLAKVLHECVSLKIFLSRRYFSKFKYFTTFLQSRF